MSQIIGRFTRLLSVCLIVTFLGCNKSNNSNFDFEINPSKEGSFTSAIGLEELPENIIDLIENTNPISENAFNTYLINEVGYREIIFIRKHKLEDILKKSKFFLHIYPENERKLTKKDSKFNNLDFDPSIETYTYNSEVYYIIHKQIPIYNISQIHFGQFDDNVTNERLWENRIDIQSAIKNSFEVDELETISLLISKSDYEKVKERRTKALKVGILESKYKKYFPFKLITNSDTLSGELKLKGDWTDHLKHEYKWSYKAKLSDEDTYLGMRKFSIQHPATRKYLNEWVMHRLSKELGLISLRYEFVNVNLLVDDNGSIDEQDLGIFALEEGFDKRLIENNQRREGVIVKFNEDIIWKDAIQSKKFWGNNQLESKHLKKVSIVEAYAENKTMKNASLKAQLLNAKDALYAYSQNEVALSEVMDIDQVAKYTAICNLLGSYHGLALHNGRWYYNPINGKLTPIPFDGMGDKPVGWIIHYPNSKQDIIYQKKFIEELDRISNEDYVSSLLDSINPDLNYYTYHLSDEFDESILFSRESLHKKAKMIRNFLYPTTISVAYFENLNQNKISVLIENKTKFPIEIGNLTYKDTAVGTSLEKEILNALESKVIEYELPHDFKNRFVSKNNPTGAFIFSKHISKISVSSNILGLSNTKKSKLIPYGRLDKENLTTVVNQFTPNHNRYDFIYVDEGDKTITIQSGNRILTNNLVFPKGYKIYATQGLFIDLQKGASIISMSPIFFKGRKDNPIVITSTNQKGGGILVLETEEKSEFKNVRFANLSNPKSKNWTVTGSVNTYEADISIDSCIFTNNRCEDALNIFRSDFTLLNSSFDSTYSDAFDGDFVTGTVSKVTFSNIGNDAIDVSGSNITINDVEIYSTQDKAISIGEKSSAIVSNCKVSDSEIGFVSKDLSNLTCEKLELINTKVAFTAFQKKSEYGPATIKANDVTIENSSTLHLIETNSSLILNNEKVATQDSVINLMYGAEFGKSSK